MKQARLLGERRSTSLGGQRPGQIGDVLDALTGLEAPEGTRFGWGRRVAIAEDRTKGMDRRDLRTTARVHGSQPYQGVINLGSEINNPRGAAWLSGLASAPASSQTMVLAGGRGRGNKKADVECKAQSRDG